MSHRRREPVHFTQFCPNCGAEYRIIKKCPKCLKYVCSQCSVGGLCLDCYTITRKRLEHRAYFEDKAADRGVVV